MTGSGTWALRAAALSGSLAVGIGAAAIFLQYSAATGLTGFAVAAAVLLGLSSCWLAWGAALGLIGLWPMPRRRPATAPITGRTCVLMPVCNEDPDVTFARIAAMDASLAGAPAEVHFAILSDTSDPGIAAREELLFRRLIAESGGEGRMFYRRRASNPGRKAGNIEDFFRRSGAAYDYALILDADSLIEGATILEMIRRIEAEPRLGLLQTLPVVIGARSLFGRAMQFAAGFYSPVFARGQARLQGVTGPFWGHNAMVRTRAFTACCGLPVLPGAPPFGGHILSHDYVEAALLARGGWTVRLDPDLTGSYEEGPESLVEYARRDRRWCQGNLQHARLVGAPGLKGWSRFVFVQGILAYMAPLFWAGFLIAMVAARATLPPPDYFPDPHQFFPVFPSDETAKAVGLAIGIVGLLIMPKLLTCLEAILSGRVRGFGGAGAALVGTLADLLLQSLMAPILMAYQTRSVLQVLTGRDGGWPANRRGDARLSLGAAFEASRFMVVIGLMGLVAARWGAPALTLWLLPVLLPMSAAPLIIAVTSLPAGRGPQPRLFATPAELDPPPVRLLHDAVLARWLAPARAKGAIVVQEAANA
jgi:membrane glycosyltransferase